MKKHAHVVSDEQLVSAARRMYGEAGRIEVDEGADVSRTDNEDADGVYVAAWVWVAFEDVNDEDSK